MKIVIFKRFNRIGEELTPYEIGLNYESQLIPNKKDFMVIDDTTFKVENVQHIIKDGEIAEVQCFCVCC